MSNGLFYVRSDKLTTIFWQIRHNYKTRVCIYLQDTWMSPSVMEKHRLRLENDVVVKDQIFFFTSTQKFTLTNASIKPATPPKSYIKMNLWTCFVFYTQCSLLWIKKIAFKCPLDKKNVLYINTFYNHNFHTNNISNCSLSNHF